ncbi:hypothetical protein A2154_00665 [Candidatus Gottesmanbacteria bacterium RBG_16_43_7]|uniref:N(6)-L-threonylcarbamoyladenine synthase n=1 Tax=Candidatus Gottesmanbacteria bacterium RBG_16_43_7 TaxID=1798373 RepID=A0A1F5Z8H3_9BACT|nr:MAG: hypothetical protein A2154_00665 [Candidatus Gottesmanbacteria bacterium RBG_16_43_7]
MHEKWGGIVPEVAARKQLEYIIPVLIEALAPFTNSREKSLAFSSKLSFGLDKTTKSNKPSNHLTIQPSSYNLQPTTDNRQQLYAYKPLIDQNIDFIAVTIGPGLIGSLLIGVEVAKTIAWICNKPIIPVNHVLAHTYANFVQSQKSKVKSQKLDKTANSHKTVLSNNNLSIQPREAGFRFAQQSSNPTIPFPAISLVVSGGHTELYLMKSPKNLKWLGGTIDDAAGEAFDKTARLIGLGAGGGLAIQNAAERYEPKTMNLPTGRQGQELKLPRPMLKSNDLNFSFSGLKTAVMRQWKTYSSVKQSTVSSQKLISAFAYEIQEAICDVLISKTLQAARRYSAKSILLSGGVAANLKLRSKFQSAIHNQQLTINLFVPPVSLCTDNAVYIAAYAFFYGKPRDVISITATPDLSVEIY